MSFASAPLECTFAFVPESGHSGQTLAGAVTAVTLFWKNDIMPLLSHELSFVAVVGRDISVAGGVSQRVDFPFPFAGGIVTSALPANVAARVSIQVCWPPGDWRSCYYLPGVPSNQVTQNTFHPEWVASVNDVASNLIDGAGLQGWEWVVPSKMSGGVIQSVAVPLPVCIVQIRSRYVGQRRRRMRNVVHP